MAPYYKYNMYVFLKSELLDFVLQIRFWNFRKNAWILKTPIDTQKQKNYKFGAKNLTTQVNMVISKMVLPHPQLDIKI